MKKTNILLLVIVSTLLCLSCGNEGGKTGQKSTELVSIKSLGLAYLEEFKLDEAEKEFLKFIKLAPKDKFGYANLGLTYLRMGKYTEAKTQLAKAIKIDPVDADIRLILATVYQMNDERPLAIAELKDALTFAPDHAKVLYDISELYSNESDTASAREHEKYVRQLIAILPGNLVPHLNLIDILIKKGKSDEAVEELETIHKQFPEFPREAAGYFDKTLSLLRKNDMANSVVQFTIFHNYMKVTAPYQAGIMELKGPGGSLIGFPLITFDQQPSSVKTEKKPLSEMMKFTDATSLAGLGLPGSGSTNLTPGYITHAETADYDGDGDIDIYAGSYDPATSTYRHYLFNNEMGKYRDVTAEAGLKHQGKENFAAFGDYDNDGFLDLYILREEGDLLYRNTGKGTFEDVTKEAGIGSKTGGKRALFADLDHDGDLDIFESTSGKNLVFRNNSDGTFTEDAAKMGLEGKGQGSSCAAIGDFDDDGDLDLFVASEKDGNALYSNQRQGVFRDMTEEAGLKETSGSNSVAVADYDNDGYLDIFTGSADGNFILYHNRRDGTFEKEAGPGEQFRKDMKNVSSRDVIFFDFDNDGFSDIMAAGEPSDQSSRGLFLYHNEGNRSFKNTDELLPQEVKSGGEISVFDYNDDGDLDFVLSGNGGISLIRNDGGNTNHFIRMKLVGLRAGSAKNNHFGIGAKVEMRAGDLYQAMVVTQPDIQFGLGSSTKVDVIRITWTNGVPQNIFFPGADQSLIEAQMLKGSCPFLYTWDGDSYEFAKDIVWRSALGMPTGIMGGETSYAFPDASDDYIKIPGENLKPDNGSYKIRITSELWETIYIDELQLVAIDHPDSVDVFVAEQFTPPPFPPLKLYVVGKKILPVTAVDGNGNNVLPLISEEDDKYLADFDHGKYQGITGMHDIVLDPGKTDGSSLFMFMNGWIFPTDASINVAMSQSSEIKVVTPEIQVIGKNGDWVTVNDRPGFPMGKDKTVIADLSGKFPTDDHRIRIRTNMEIYWDQIFFSDCASPSPLIMNTIDAESADLHYRGFSRMYRKGGPDGPHWFDYSDVTGGQKWRDLEGNYTRYGDVLPLVTESDNKYIITNAGDETSVTFPGKGLPALQKGWKRDFLIHSVGWVKDGDLNTATGNTVMPLPFHGMKRYPPGKDDVYPDSPELRKYNQEYNTRVVTDDDFKNAIRENKNLVEK